MAILPVEHRVLLMAFAEQQEYLTLLYKKDYLEYYGYWNNTDPPENVTEKAWAHREKIWNEALKKDGIPSQNGFSVDLHHPVLYWNLKIPKSIPDIINALPTFELRLEKLAYRGAINEAIKIVNGDKEFDSSEIGSTYFNAEDYLKNHPDILIKYKDKIGNSLIKTITEKELLKPFSGE